MVSQMRYMHGTLNLHLKGGSQSLPDWCCALLYPGDYLRYIMCVIAIFDILNYVLELQVI